MTEARQCRAFSALLVCELVRLVMADGANGVGDAVAAAPCGARLRLRRPDATAWQQMEGCRPLHDGQGGRFRTASLHSPAAR